MSAIPYDVAISDVKSRVAKSRTSFSAGMAVLPEARRQAMYALYAFCREVDDIADDSPTPEAAAQGLAQWRKRIADLFKGKTSETITTALLPAIKEYELVEVDFQAIIDGMVMDSVVICAPTFEVFDRYCDLVASAVGRVSVRIFGDACENALQVAFHQGRALQMTNILRDLKEDAARGRMYLPSEYLSKHGITSRLPEAILNDARLPNVCREVAAKAREHFIATEEAMTLCKPAAMRPARIMKAYYSAILDRLVKEDWADLSKRVSLPLWQKLLLIVRYGLL